MSKSKKSATKPQFMISICDEEVYPHGPYDTEVEAMREAIRLGVEEYANDYDRFRIGKTTPSIDFAMSKIDSITDDFFEQMHEYLVEAADIDDDFLYYSNDDKSDFKVFLRMFFNSDRYNYLGLIRDTTEYTFDEAKELVKKMECNNEG